MNKSVDSKTVFKFLDAQLLVRRVRPYPAKLLDHNSTPTKVCFAWYNLTSVELKSFTFSAEPQSFSIDNAVLISIPKRLLFTMFKNTDFIGSLDSNPYKFQHYDFSDFSLFVNVKQFPNEDLSPSWATDVFRGVWHALLEFRTAGNTRYIYNRLYHVTL